MPAKTMVFAGICLGCERKDRDCFYMAFRALYRLRKRMLRQRQKYDAKIKRVQLYTDIKCYISFDEIGRNNFTPFLLNGRSLLSANK